MSEEIPTWLGPFSNYTMSTVPDFDEKKFWIVLFSIVARREAARENGIQDNRRARPWLRVIRNPAQDSDSATPDRKEMNPLARRLGPRLVSETAGEPLAEILDLG